MPVRIHPSRASRCSRRSFWRLQHPPLHRTARQSAGSFLNSGSRRAIGAASRRISSTPLQVANNSSFYVDCGDLHPEGDVARDKDRAQLFVPLQQDVLLAGARLAHRRWLRSEQLVGRLDVQNVGASRRGSPARSYAGAGPESWWGGSGGGSGGGGGVAARPATAMMGAILPSALKRAIHSTSLRASASVVEHPIRGSCAIG